MAGVTDVVDVAAGDYHTCIIVDADRNGLGDWRCFGQNDAGQLGNGSAGSTDYAVPQAVQDVGTMAAITDATIIASGTDFGCAVRGSAGTAVSCVGWQYGGRLGNGVTTSSSATRAVPVMGLPGVRVLGLGGVNVTGMIGAPLAPGFSAVSWGFQPNGQSGTGISGSVAVATPIVPDTLEVQQMTSSTNQACLRYRSGATSRARCAGFGSSGALGVGAPSGGTLTFAADVVVNGGAPLEGVRQIEVGTNFTCALTDASVVMCFGQCDVGECGDGVASDHAPRSPIPRSRCSACCERVRALTRGPPNLQRTLRASPAGAWETDVSGTAQVPGVTESGIGRWVAAGAVALALLLSPGLGGRACAQEGADDEARGLFLAGQAAFDAARYEDALAYFRRAHERSARPELLYNVAIAADRLRHDDEALEAFEGFLAGTPPDAPQRRDVEARIAVLREAIARREAATELAVSDAEPVANPEPEIRGGAGSSRAGGRAGRTRRTIGGWSLVGGGAAVAVAGAVLLGVGRAEADRVEHAVPGTPWPDVAGAAASATWMSPTGIALTAIGAAAAAGGVVWLALDGPDTGADVQVGVALGGMRISGRF